MLKFLVIGLPVVALLYAGFVFLRGKYSPQTLESDVVADAEQHGPSSVSYNSVIEQEPPRQDPGISTTETDTPELSKPKPFGVHIPQEPTLRRHYLTHIRGLLNAVNPCPTDSVLQRHHAQLISSQFDTCLHDPAAVARLEENYWSLQQP